MKEAISFGKLLYKARTSQNYKQREVATATSISVRWYQEIESGRRLPSGKTAIRVAAFLKLDFNRIREEAGLIDLLPSV